VQRWLRKLSTWRVDGSWPARCIRVLRRVPWRQLDRRGRRLSVGGPPQALPELPEQQPRLPRGVGPSYFSTTEIKNTNEKIIIQQHCCLPRYGFLLNGKSTSVSDPETDEQELNLNTCPWGQNITTTLKLFENQVFARESVDDFGRTCLRSRDDRRVNRCVLAVIAHRHRRVATFDSAEEYFTQRFDGST